MSHNKQTEVELRMYKDLNVLRTPTIKDSVYFVLNSVTQKVNQIWVTNNFNIAKQVELNGTLLIQDLISSQVGNEAYLSIVDGKLQVNPLISPNGSVAILKTPNETQIQIESSLLIKINNALQAGDIPVFNPSDYDLEEFTNTSLDPFAKISDINSVINLSYIASPMDGTIANDVGTDATIPLANLLNAGLLSPQEKLKLSDISGSNTGDQTSIVGISGTKAQYNTTLTEGDFLFVGDVINYTNEEAQDSVGTILTDSGTIDFTYDDITPSISAIVKPNSIDATHLGNSINISEFVNDTNYASTTYVDSLVVGLLDDRGSYDASGNIFPVTGGSGVSGAILKGDIWYVSVAGVLAGKDVNIGDSFRAITDNPAQIITNWSVLEANIGYIPENVINKSTNTILGTSNILYPTQNAVKTYTDSKVTQTITNGITTSAPSEDAVFDALALKYNTSNPSGYISDVNLTYTPSPTNGTVINDKGLDATIPLANGTNAGLITSAEKTSIATAVQPAALNNYVPYTGALTNVDLGEFHAKVGQLELDQTPTGAFTSGKIRWNDSDGTIEVMLKGGNVTLQVGQEQVLRVVNKTGINLLESQYKCVYISGSQGNRLKVDLALSNNSVNSSKTIGIVTENINNNLEGFVTTSGLVRGINTTGSLQSETWVDGDILYLSATISGGISNVLPVSPNHKVLVGYVVNTHITQGAIFVKVDTGLALHELHNVNVVGSTINKVVGSTVEGLWENKTVSQVLGYTPENLANKSNALTASNTLYPNNDSVISGLALKANLASPNLTGIPTAPTPAAGTSTTQLATTAFVGTAISAVDVNNVKITGNQTIAGQKTFSNTNTIFGNQITHYYQDITTNPISWQIKDLAPSQGAFSIGTNTVNMSMREGSPRYISVTNPIESPLATANNHLVNLSQVPIQLKDFFVDVNNTSITETDLFTYNTTANRLNSTGEKIVATYAGTFNDTTAASQLKVIFTGQTIGDTGALTMSVTGAWIINTAIMRTGVTTARSTVNISTPGASTASYTKYTLLTGLDFTSTNIIKITGTASGATGGSSDITATYGNIQWQPAAI